MRTGVLEPVGYCTRLSFGLCCKVKTSEMLCSKGNLVSPCFLTWALLGVDMQNTIFAVMP